MKKENNGALIVTRQETPCKETQIKKEYDFSKAEQGKFYCKPENMKIQHNKKGSAPDMRHHMPTDQSQNSAT